MFEPITLQPNHETHSGVVPTLAATVFSTAAYSTLLHPLTLLLCISLIAYKTATQLVWIKPQPTLRVNAVCALFLFVVVILSGADSLQEISLSVLLCVLLIKIIQSHSLAHDALAVNFLMVSFALIFSTSMFNLACAVAAISLSLYAAAIAAQTEKTFTKSFPAIAKTLLIPLAIAIVVTTTLPVPQAALNLNTWQSSQAQTGAGESLQPGSISQLTDNHEIVFRARFNNQPTNIEDLYWRERALNHYDGQTWTGHLIDSQNGHTDARKPPSQSITINPSAGNTHRIFTLDIPSTDPIDVHANVKLPNLYGRKARTLATELSAPYQTFSAGADELFVLNVLNYFHQGDFYYSMSPPLYAYDAVDEFLFGKRTGFCEHYASAFTFLMRAAGIPARVITGYHGGELSHNGEYIIVRQSHAHAWTEVWLHDKGWTRIDPTTAIPDSHVINAQTTPAHGKWFKQFFGKPPHQLSIVRLLEHGVYTFNQWLSGLANQVRQSMRDYSGGEFIPAILFMLGLFAALFAGLRHLQETFRLSPAQRRYRRFCKQLKRIDLIKLPQETGLSFAARVINARPDLRDAVNEATQAYYQAMYGKQVE